MSLVNAILLTAALTLLGLHNIYAAEAPDWRAGAAYLERCGTDPDPAPGCDVMRHLAGQVIAVCDRALGAWDDAGRPAVTDQRVAQRLSDCLDMRDSGLEEALRGYTGPAT